MDENWVQPMTPADELALKATSRVLGYIVYVGAALAVLIVALSPVLSPLTHHHR